MEMFLLLVKSLVELTDLFHPSGGRSSQAIVDGAMNALRTLVKDRLSGKSGSSGYSKQVGEVMNMHM